MKWEMYMHEVALMGDILDLIKNDAEKRNIKRVSKVELVVGELSNALPDALEMAFDIFKSRNIEMLQKDAELIIIKEEAKAKCVLCGLEYHPSQHVAVCPECNFPSGELTAGETLKVKSYQGE